MGGFRGIEWGKFPQVFIFGYIAFLVIVQALKSFGWVKSGMNLGAGFAILAAGAGMLIVYKVVIDRSLKLEFRDVFTILLLGGFLVAILIVVPQIAPDVFKASISQMNVAMMSIFGG